MAAPARSRMSESASPIPGLSPLAAWIVITILVALVGLVVWLLPLF